MADDATAVSFNPSGLAQLLRPEVSVAGRWSKRGVAYEDVVTQAGSRTLLVSDSLISHSRVEPTFLSASVPLRMGDRTLAFQLSFQRTLPLTVKDSRDLVENAQDGTVPARLFQSIDQQGQIDQYSFAAAYEASERILIGVAVNLWRGVWDLDSHSQKSQGTAVSYVDVSQGSRLEGASYNLGLLWRWPTWSLGLVQRTGFQASYRSDFSFASRRPGKPIRTSSGSFDGGIHWPSTTSLGLAYRPMDGWLAAVDLNRTRWSKATLVQAGSSMNGLGFFDLQRPTRTPDTTDVHVGIEHLLVTARGLVVPLRLGWSREPQPLVDRVTSSQRVMQGLSLGTGVKMGRYTLDGAYRIGWGRRYASQFLDVDQLLTQARPTSLGDERVREHRVEASLILQFDRQAVERVLRHLFYGG